MKVDQSFLVFTGNKVSEFSGGTVNVSEGGGGKPQAQ